MDVDGFRQPTAQERRQRRSNKRSAVNVSDANGRPKKTKAHQSVSDCDKPGEMDPTRRRQSKSPEVVVSDSTIRQLRPLSQEWFCHFIIMRKLVALIMADINNSSSNNYYNDMCSGSSFSNSCSPQPDNALTIFQWNCHGLSAHKEELKLHLSSTGLNYDIVCLQETFLKPGSTFDMRGYRMIRRDRHE